MNELKENRRYRNLEEETLIRTVWTACVGSSARQYAVYEQMYENTLNEYVPQKIPMFPLQKEIVAV